MLRSLLAALLLLGLFACTPQEPEFTEADQVSAADRPPEETPDGGDDAGDGGGGETLTFVARNINFDETSLEVPAGTVTFELVNEDAIPHDVTIEELGDRTVVTAETRGTETGRIELEAGAYTFYCSVPGHRQAGMEGDLTVS